MTTFDTLDRLFEQRGARIGVDRTACRGSAYIAAGELPRVGAACDSAAPCPTDACAALQRLEKAPKRP
jgi:hypothetical protein